MRALFLSLCFILAAAASVSGQANFLSQIAIYKLQDKQLGTIEIGVLNKDITKKKPLLLVLGGSGLEPTFKFNKQDGRVYWTGFYGFSNYQDRYHIVYLNKAGIPLYDTVQSQRTVYKYGAVAKANNTLDWRAESASKAINFLVKKLPVEAGQVYVVGHSQGGQVAPKVAVLNRRVKKVVMMSSNTLDHLYDRILLARLKAQNLEMSYQESQHVVDSLLQVQRAIYTHPADTTRTFWEDTYKKWYSYSKETPLENMLRLQIPILLIAGGRDVEGSYIANTDYAALEFIRKGKTNLTYKVYPTYDHIYMETTRRLGEEVGLGMKANIVIADVMSWLAQ
ncbi:hypothetical protein IC235_18090 [Hymenobacter sp. BT664]|uniref:Alpha/beta hydrolase n=1 Tax=Hymenobacter montanus TaxID=2771359 RepID=A0A927BGT8_9BACT|nr:hypothetical protein [Hymenobacter montanus]MBD2769803.1 hypothetical protein [Hymenobacter montanus]